MSMMQLSNHTTAATSYSESTLVATTRTVCQIWISIPVALCGIVGNSLSIVVFNRYKQAKSATMLLQSIAVIETLILTLFLILGPLKLFEIPFLVLFVSHTFSILYPFTYFFKIVNIWLTVLLTVERCIAVCSPLKAQFICTSKRTKIAIVVIILLVALFTTPRFYEYHRVSFDESPAGFQHTSLMSNYTYTIVYRIILFLLLGYIIPIILLIFLNIKITSALRWASQQHRSFFLFHNNNKSTSAQTSLCEMTQSLTTIAVIVVSVFIVCNTTVMASHVLYSIEVAFESLKDSIELHRRLMVNVSNVLATISCSINFFIYCLFSSRFRLILRNTVCCKRSARSGVSDFYLSTRKTMIFIKKVGAESWKKDDAEDIVVYKHKDTLNIVFNKE